MKIRFQQQCEHSECGLACASMIIDFYIKKTKLSSLREQYGVPNGGYNLLQIKAILKENGVNISRRHERNNTDSRECICVIFCDYNGVNNYKL